MEKSLIWKRNKVRQIKNERDVLVKHLTKYFVKLMYSFQDKSNLYLAMEFCSGGDLRHLLSDLNVLSEEDTRIYMAQMILATHHLHECGYIHRDLKPDNFLIDKNGHLKLADFGLSKEGATSKIESHKSQENLHSPSLSLLSKTYSVVGSPNYMSPEVLNGDNGYSVEVDWWSLGCILFEMLVGYPPFSGGNPEEVFRNILNWKSHLETVIEEVEEYLSTEAIDLIRKLLSEKNERIGSTGIDKIKSHSFFDKFDWDDIDNMEPPFLPSLRDDLDTTYFDTNSDKEPSLPADNIEVNEVQPISKTPTKQFISNKENYEPFVARSNIKYHYRKRSQDETRLTEKLLCSVNYAESKKRKRYSERDVDYRLAEGNTTPDSLYKSPGKEIFGFTYQRKVTHKSKSSHIAPFPLDIDSM